DDRDPLSLRKKDFAGRAESRVVGEGAIEKLCGARRIGIPPGVIDRADEDAVANPHFGPSRPRRAVRRPDEFTALEAKVAGLSGPGDHAEPGIVGELAVLERDIADWGCFGFDIHTSAG